MRVQQNTILQHIPEFHSEGKTHCIEPTTIINTTLYAYKGGALPCHPEIAAPHNEGSGATQQASESKHTVTITLDKGRAPKKQTQ